MMKELFVYNFKLNIYEFQIENHIISEFHIKTAIFKYEIQNHNSYSK